MQGMSTSLPHELIAQLRRERGESLEAFGAAVGISSKGRVSEIERGIGRAVTAAQALEIERLSGWRIDAARLNPVIAAARAGQLARDQRSHDSSSAIDDPLPECAGGGVAGASPHPGPAPETGKGAAAMRPGARALSGGRGRK